MRNEIKRLLYEHPHLFYTDAFKLAASYGGFDKTPEYEDELKRTIFKVSEASRDPSGYRLFMKNEVKRILDISPYFSQKEAFKIVGSNWRFYKEEKIYS